MTFLWRRSAVSLSSPCLVLLSLMPMESTSRVRGSTLDEGIGGHRLEVPGLEELGRAPGARVLLVLPEPLHVVVEVADGADEQALPLLPQDIEDIGRPHLALRDEDLAQPEVEVQAVEPLLLEDRVLEVVHRDQGGGQRELPELALLLPDRVRSPRPAPPLLSPDLEDHPELLIVDVAASEEDFAQRTVRRF